MEKKNTKKASILAFTLIMLSILLLAGLSLMGSVAVDQRASIDSRKSVQALQSAESGSDIMVSKIRNNASGAISDLGSCSDGVIEGISSQGTYTVSFLDEDENPLACGSLVEDIAKVKSIGAYAQTNRAVEVSVAAGGYRAIDYGNCETKKMRNTSLGTNRTETCSNGFRLIDHARTDTNDGDLNFVTISMNNPNGGDSITLSGRWGEVTFICCELVDVGS